MLDARTKQIWRGLVDYADASDLESNTKALKNLAHVISDCMPWMARTEYTDDVPSMLAVQTNPDALRGLVEGKKEPVWMCFKSEQELMNQFRKQAVEYQPQMRRLLTWLSSPKQNAEERPIAFSFLYEHTWHIKFQRGDPAFAPEPEEEKLRYWMPVRHWTLDGKPKDETFELKDDFPHRTMAYKDIADPICDFIQRQHELERDVPIQICKRPGCGNLVVRFKKKEYCRTALCDRERQKRDDDVKQKKNRDRVFFHRLNRLSRPMRRKKAQEKVGDLREIEAYWRDSNHANETLARKASKLLALAGNTSETTPRSSPAEDSTKG